MSTFRKLLFAQIKKVSGGGSMGAFTLLAHVGSETNSNGTTSAAINTTGAKLIVIGASTYSGIPNPTDSAGNTWTLIGTVQDNSYSLRLFYCLNPITSSSHTFTLNGTGNYPCISVLAFSGTFTLGYDKELQKSSLSGTSIQPGAITASNSPALIICTYLASDTSTVSIDSSFIKTDQNGGPSGGAITNANSYLNQAIASSINPTWSNSGSSGTLLAIIASFI